MEFIIKYFWPFVLAGIIRNWVGIWELLSAKLLSILLWFLSGYRLLGFNVFHIHV